MKKFEGIFTALITPFKNGEVDKDSLAKLVRFQIEKGIHGFVISGTTAESPTLSFEEKKSIFELVKTESGGRVPLVVGTGTNSTNETVFLTQEAQKWGADGVLVVVPYYNKPPQRGLFQHFEKIAKSTSLPVILYNVPARTITKLELETIVELSRIENIKGIKEASGDISFGRQICESCGPEFLLTSGDDGTFLELMQAGGHGAISVASHILPKEFVGWFERMNKGQTNAVNEFTQYMGLVSQLYVESSPIPVKMALYLMGIISSPELRLPLVSLSEPNVIQLKKHMKEFKLI